MKVLEIWREKFRNRQVSDVKRLKQLESENSNLKLLPTGTMMAKQILLECLKRIAVRHLYANADIEKEEPID